MTQQQKKLALDFIKALMIYLIMLAAMVQASMSCEAMLDGYIYHEGENHELLS